MRAKLIGGLLAGLVAGMVVASTALADKLLCVSNEKLRGQVDANTCLTQGERFAIMDDQGAVRILRAEEIKLMKRLNPQAFEQPAYGILYQREAPEIPKLPPLAVPKLAH